MKNKDKLMHIIVWAGMMMCFSLLFGSFLFSAILALAFGLIKEFHDDHFDWWDLLADCVGILIGGLIYLL